MPPRGAQRGVERPPVRRPARVACAAVRPAGARRCVV